jgi:hypothetical protein
MIYLRETPKVYTLEERIQKAVAQWEETSQLYTSHNRENSLTQDLKRMIGYHWGVTLEQMETVQC